jgi:hypothetical protein
MGGVICTSAKSTATNVGCTESEDSMEFEVSISHIRVCCFSLLSTVHTINSANSGGLVELKKKIILSNIERIRLSFE